MIITTAGCKCIFTADCCAARLAKPVACIGSKAYRVVSRLVSTRWHSVLLLMVTTKRRGEVALCDGLQVKVRTYEVATRISRRTKGNDDFTHSRE